MSLRTIIEGLGGATAIALELLSPWRRKWRTRWGTTPDERSTELPGDELVPNPKWEYTHAITIDASISETWPWIVQIGQGRGGFYSYESLENLVGCSIYNTTKIMPEFQDLKVGDGIKLHPKVPPMRVAQLQPGHALVLHASEDIRKSPSNDIGDGKSESPFSATWQFILEEIEEKKTRLITRGRYFYSPGLANKLSFGPTVSEPISFVMERKMLKEVKRLAENN
jgi:hypothetical protein